MILLNGTVPPVTAGEGGELNRYQIVGRLKDLIIRGGMKIAPEEIEALLSEHPKVAVVTVPDRRLDDERICAIVVTKKEQTLSIDELHDFLKTRDMAAYRMPRKLLTALFAELQIENC